jgi:periplasmic glucans biosynthesis protein
MQRRHFLQACAALIARGLSRPGQSAAGPGTTALSPLGKPQTFDYAWLKGQARALANGTYQPPVSQIPDAVRALDYDRTGCEFCKWA